MRRITDRAELELLLRASAWEDAKGSGTSMFFNTKANMEMLALWDEGNVIAETDDKGKVTLSLTAKGLKEMGSLQ